MIKSQDELNTCNDGRRGSAVLISTIEKCEKLEKQLEIAAKALEEFAYSDNWNVEKVEGEYAF